MFIEWSDIGTYHIEHNKENEDAIRSIKDGGSAAIALCDGVSTCDHSKEGASVACNSLCSFFIKKRTKLERYDERTIAQKAVSHIKYDLNKQAKISSNTMESLSSTASCVLYDGEAKKIICLNIGDALVGGISKSGFEVLMKPQVGNNGCFVTTTKGVDRVAKVLLLDSEKYDSVFICSDGMWKQLYKSGDIKGDIRKHLDRNEIDMVIDMVRNDRGCDDRSMVVMNINN